MNSLIYLSIFIKLIIKFYILLLLLFIIIIIILLLLKYLLSTQIKTKYNKIIK